MALFIGASGFSYPDWRGPFYPEKLPAREMLAHYAQHFNVVEINATYYRMPDAQLFTRMQAKVPDTFRFAVKASKELTHEIGPEVAAAFQQFAAAIAPLQEAGQLACVLAQFPWSFRDTPVNRAYLASLPERLPDVPLVVEFRNHGWVREETFALLRENGLGFCCVDEPRLKGLMPPLCLATSPIGYVRFHGRNAAKWWEHDEAWERYDYRYPEEELQEWVPPIQQLAGETKDTYVFFNNHHRGKATDNAQMLRQMLLPIEY